MARRTALALIMAFAFLLPIVAQEGGRAYTVESVPNVHVADRRQYVSDPARLMSAAARDTVNALLARLEATTGIETAVVVLPSIGEAAPFDFAQSLFRHWGVGKAESDNGLLILYVGDQRKIRFHTGYGIEGYLTDAMGKRIQSRYMVPAFRRGDVSSGIVAGVGAVCAVLDGTMKPEAPADEGIGMAPIVMFIIILAVVLAATGVFGQRKRRCPNCGLRKLSLMSTDFYRAADGRRMRKDVYVCAHCGKVTVENTPADDDRHGGSGLGSFLAGMMLGSLLHGGRGGYGGGGGGFSGGSFGGGDSGGGGSESSW